MGQFLARRGVIPPEHLPDLPHTFAAYDEGKGLRSLYLAPLLPTHIVAALRALGLVEDMVDVTPRWGATCATKTPVFAIATAKPPLELLHGRPPDTRPAHTLMADPHAALPDRTRRVAVSLHDQCHGVVYSHDTEVLAAFLATWLRSALSVQAPVVSRHHDLPPEIPTDLASLLEPVPAGSWWEPSLSRQRRFWTADFVLLTAPAPGQLEEGARVRWVGTPEEAWRPGWWW